MDTLLQDRQELHDENPIVDFISAEPEENLIVAVRFEGKEMYPLGTIHKELNEAENKWEFFCQSNMAKILSPPLPDLAKAERFFEEYGRQIAREKQLKKIREKNNERGKDQDISR